VFQYIASGLIGRQAFQSGWASVLLGIALHYIIALIWTAVFYVIARKFTIVMRRPVLSGLLYGGVVYLIMNFIVVPLSGVAHPLRPITLVSRINAVLALLICIGLPISLLTRRTLFQVRN
jgi:uncharacterized membrane protein YagU involved in acid resistance